MDRHRERLYDTLAEMLPAFPSAREVLRLVAERPGPAPFRALASAARDGVDRGQSLAESLERAPAPPPASETALIRAAEKAGTLAEALRSLATELRAARTRLTQLLGRLAYPALVFHLAAFTA